MRIAITGYRGQVGTALRRRLSSHHILLGLDVPEADITDKNDIVRRLVDFRPDVTIHAAAMTNVDGCARDPDQAYLINAVGTQNVALGCREVDAVMVYISTNEVFDGTASEPYLEFDRPNPINVYGRSKLAGEQYTQMLVDRFYIVRTAWVYGPQGNHFVRKIVRAADERGRVSVVVDEVSSPTYAPDLAEAIMRLLETKAYGIYHFTNEGVCSRYDFALEVLELSGRGHVPVAPITSDQYRRASQPPLYTPLRNFCGAALGIRLRFWQDALKEYLVDHPEF